MKQFSPRVNSTKVANIVSQNGTTVGLLSFELQQILLSLGADPNAEPFTPAVGASPFVYVNERPFRQSAFAIGGTVSNLALSRAGGAYVTVASSVVLNPGDALRITYSVAPVLQIIPS